jgi:hypothetical protein
MLVYIIRFCCKCILSWVGTYLYCRGYKDEMWSSLIMAPWRRGLREITPFMQAAIISMASEKVSWQLSWQLPLADHRTLHVTLCMYGTIVPSASGFSWYTKREANGFASCGFWPTTHVRLLHRLFRSFSIVVLQCTTWAAFIATVKCGGPCSFQL